VHRCRLNTYGRPRAFPVDGLTVWNILPDELRDPVCDVDSFKQFFKTILLSFTDATIAHYRLFFNVMRLRDIHSRFTYLRTYFGRSQIIAYVYGPSHDVVGNKLTNERIIRRKRHFYHKNGTCTFLRSLGTGLDVKYHYADEKNRFSAAAQQLTDETHDAVTVISCPVVTTTYGVRTYTR